MPKKKLNLGKLNLSELRVESFVTSSEEMRKVEGGGRTDTGCVDCQSDPFNCVTFNC